MKTTASYKFNDPIRKRFVSATPEEGVRQALLQKMLGELGFPKAYLAVEKKISGLLRRVDLICYTNQIDVHHLLPLLVVECKARASKEAARDQLLGYNHAIGAPFLCLADEKGAETFWFRGTEMKSVPFLPAYQELCRYLK